MFLPSFLIYVAIHIVCTQYLEVTLAIAHITIYVPNASIFILCTTTHFLLYLVADDIYNVTTTCEHIPLVSNTIFIQD